jgi:polyhydroxyalkanoate synthesis regulator phasin
MEYVTVSAKIPKKLKELMDRYGIKPGPLIRRAIEEEVRKRALSKLEQELSDILNELSVIPDEEVVKLIREDREGR